MQRKFHTFQCTNLLKYATGHKAYSKEISSIKYILLNKFIHAINYTDKIKKINELIHDVFDDHKTLMFDLVS